MSYDEAARHREGTDGLEYEDYYERVRPCPACSMPTKNPVGMCDDCNEHEQS